MRARILGARPPCEPTFPVPDGARLTNLDRIRVIDLETAGDAAHEVCEIGWQDVVRDPGGTWRLDDERGARFVNPGRPISPDTMAVHHILDAQVADAPLWKAIAPEILRPEGSVLALAAHRAAFEQRYCRPSLTGGADWICTWKCALRVWPQLMRFPTRCCATSAIRKAWCTISACRRTAPCLTPTSPPTTCATC